jgi:ATP-binding cassette subfamily B protein RaxB
MRPVLQSEASECGLACLAGIAGHHGMQISLRELRLRYPLSLKGATMTRLGAIAADIGLQARALRLELDDLDKLALPCVLHWDLNHFVVLKRVRRDRLTIHDPAMGERSLTRAQASPHFTGVALELHPTTGFAPVAATPPVSLRQLTGHVHGGWRSLALIFALSAALQLFVLSTPWFMQLVVDQVLVTADRDLLTVLGLGFGLSLLLQVAASQVRGLAVVHLSSQLGLGWTGNVFGHLLKLPLDFFDKRHLGDITSRMGAVQTIQRTLTTSFIEAIVDGLMAVATLAMMLVYSAKLALVTLLAVALYLMLRVLCYRPAREGVERHLVAGARQQSHLLESIRGMPSIRVAGCESERCGHYAALVHQTNNREVWLSKLALATASANQLIFGAERIAVVWMGAALALQNVFSVGMLVAYLAYKDQFASRIGGLIDKAIEFRMLRLHAERLADIVLTQAEDIGPASASTAAIAMRLEVKDLAYRYAEGEPWVVRDCSFTVEEGECIAIVGASGCGKTTLVKLLLGLLRPTHGSIAVGGVDLQRLGPRRLREQAGVVMQDDQLFAGSIAQNIALGDDAGDLARIEAAARLAAVHEDIAAMPMGYQSLVGDMGTSLSGGQKQRVILARALYRRPRVLFLDEATSHLDVQCERRVGEAVRGLRLTRIIIAHRPETIASADRVLVMQDGRIVQQLRPRAAIGVDPAEAV